ncbi:MAG: DUF421 domain-containing protein [Pseudobdellovibrionaceae bacterium]|nr:DUF421 domain-containing protein [Pseudobdellovibrionaceae bacterium]
MIFESWHGILRVVILGTSSYAALIFLLRVSGKRTLSKMNSFDMVVTIALGSTLSSIILSKSVALMEGLTALLLLILLQYCISWSAIRFNWVNRVIKNEPTLLVRKGQLLKKAMKQERVTEEEILQAVRNEKIGSLSQVEALVLETDGSMSVLMDSTQKLVSWTGLSVP